MGIRFEFNKGVPPGCVRWLWENVGQGNIGKDTNRNYKLPTDSWFYERISIPIIGDPFEAESHVPTITIYDLELALLFRLRWA